jgi:hypothetical protein
MTGKFYIDGIDAYLSYGCTVTEGGYDELIAYASLKDVKTNDWHEQDGIEADLSNPKLNTKEFNMSFAFTQFFNRATAFIEHLSDKAYHTFYFADIERTYKLRLVSEGKHDIIAYIRDVTLKFADDFPLKDYVYVAPSSTVQTSNECAIDDIPLTDYGVRLLYGTMAEVEKAPQVKANLTRNISINNGVEYADTAVRYKSKEVKLSCVLRAETLSELWKNYDALLYNLTKSGERQLYINSNEETYPCYYKSAAVQHFLYSPRIWLEFTVTLIFTRFRPEGDSFLLSSEDNILIITEQNDNAINLSPYGN